MGQSVGDYEEEYRRKFRAVRPIFEKHFPAVEQQKIPGLVHHFTMEKSAGLYENWNYDQQQELLSKLRAQLARAAESLSKIHKVVLSEVSVNLCLPLDVLNGTHDWKTCAKEVYETAPAGDVVSQAEKVFHGLLSFSENIDKAIKYTQGELPVGISVGNRNIDAWRIVEAAVEVCRVYPNSINVPKKMNGSGPLRRLLVDLFKHYEINSNVDAAFNGWQKHIDSKREFLDLLPIE